MNRLFIVCEHSTNGLMVSFVKAHKDTDFLGLCDSEESLERIIREKFLSVDISLPFEAHLTTANEKSAFSQEIRRLEHELKSKMLLIVLEQRCIHLFGLVDMVEEFQTEIDEMKKTHVTTAVKLNFQPRQVEKDP
jgi:hypothetical protein